MKKNRVSIILFVFACLLFTSVVSADEGDVGRPHDKNNEAELQEIE
ncbi:hypothetical protein [Sporosarcina cyprini]|nr:hypothetical protein [Sporosarcina cyprini]MCG3086670.1 hypothetical protein [Sporosarcina cyprini]